MDIVVPAFISATLGMIVFFLGAFLTRRAGFLRDYNIPEPISGGIAVAILTWAWFVSTGGRITFEMEVRDYLLVLFFSTIGLNARIADLLRGRPAACHPFGPDSGLHAVAECRRPCRCDSVRPAQRRIGAARLGFADRRARDGHRLGADGTAIAWGPQVQEMSGFVDAAEIGVATATLGLVPAALIGGTDRQAVD